MNTLPETNFGGGSVSSVQFIPAPLLYFYIETVPVNKHLVLKNFVSYLVAL